VLSLARPPCDTGVIRGAPETPGCASHAKRWVLAASILGSSVASLEASVINVALPAIQQGLGASVAAMQWIASIYTLFLGALTLAAGSAGDRFGRRKLFAAGLAILAVASVAAGFAADAAQLIAARAVQGVGAALLVPNSLSLVSAGFPRTERGRAIGTWSAATAITSSGGPILGGVVVDVSSWRSVFFLIVPLALVTLVLAWTRLPDVRIGRRQPAVDWAGAALATAGLAGVVFGIIRLRTGTAALLPLAGGLGLLGVFVWFETRIASPIMPPRLFRSPTFLGANLLTLLLYFAITAAFFVMPFVLVRVYGYSATATGAAYLPFALLIGVLSRRTGALADRFGPRPPLVVGPLVTAAGLLLLAVPGTTGSYWTTFFPPMVVMGLGMAITVAPLTTTVMTAVDESEVGVASGVNNTVARVAALLAVAIGGLVALETFDRSLSERLAVIDLSPAVRSALAAQSPNLGEVVAPAGASASERHAIDDAAAQALVTSFRWTDVLAALLAAASALAAALLIESVPSRAPAGDGVALMSCAHLDLVLDPAPRTQGCEECLRLGERWVHLRMCLTCGHVGCCDASRRRHATAHFWTTQHPLVRSLEPGEDWRWCYLDDTTV
jgi:EmrB/QacA subfamily drug resistance transporter